MTEIPSALFSGMIDLESVGDLSSLKTIGGSAFQGCASLKRLGDMPKLETIGSDAFGTYSVWLDSILHLIPDVFFSLPDRSS